MARIFLAEDQRELSRMISSSLRIEGHQVESVADGQSALERLLEGKYDLAILDIHLPGMSGVEICNQLQARGRANTPHILVISADADPHQIQSCLAAGAEAYLNKPFSLSNLLQSVDNLLGKEPIKTS